MFAIMFLSLAVLFGVLLSLFSLLLEEYTLKRYQRPKALARLFMSVQDFDEARGLSLQS